MIRSLLCLVGLVAATVASAAPRALNDAEVAAQLRRMQQETSKSLPLVSGPSVVVSVVSGPGRSFTYVSNISVAAHEWTAEMKSHSRRIAINDYCTSPGMRWFRANLVQVSWQLSDTQGRHILTNAVAPSDCR